MDGAGKDARSECGFPVIAGKGLNGAEICRLKYCDAKTMGTKGVRLLSYPFFSDQLHEYFVPALLGEEKINCITY